MKVQFITFDPSQSRREQELEIAGAKSHAARTSHQRKKKLSKTCPWTQKKNYTAHTYAVIQINGPVFIKGASDPFSAFGVEITPRINQILAFARDVCVPASYFNSMFMRLSDGVSNTRKSILEDTFFISRCAARREWQALVDSLRSELTALSCIMGYASLMAIASPASEWIKAFCLRLKTRALALLRESTLDYKNDPQGLTLQLNRFYRAACIEGDAAAVDCHGSMLRKLLEEGTGFSYQALIQVLFNDGDFATKHERRCTLDVEPDGWTARALTKLWTMAAPYFPRTPTEDRDIHKNVTLPETRDLFARTRDVLDVMYHRRFPPVKWTDGSAGDIAFASATSRALLDNAMMNNLYLDLSEARKMQHASEGQRQTQAAIVVAHHYLKRRIGGEAMVNGVDVRGASPVLMRQLQRAVTAAFEVCTIDELSDFADAHLWVLYVGALDEMHQRLGSDTRGRLKGAWFCQFLVWQARLTDVLTWEALQKLAKRFLYAEFISPDGSLWFEDLLVESKIL